MKTESIPLELIFTAVAAFTAHFGIYPLTFVIIPEIVPEKVINKANNYIKMIFNQIEQLNEITGYLHFIISDSNLFRNIRHQYDVDSVIWLFANRYDSGQ